MAGSGSPLVALTVRSAPADREERAAPRLVALVPVARTPSETAALPLITPTDLIRAARARARAAAHLADRTEKHLAPVRAIDARPVVPSVAIPLPRPASAPTPGATRLVTRVPAPRRAPGDPAAGPTAVRGPGSPARGAPDPLAAVLASLSRAAARPRLSRPRLSRPVMAHPVLTRPGTAPLVLALVLAVTGVVLLVLAIAGQVSPPAATDTGDLAPAPAAAPPAAPTAAPTVAATAVPRRLVVPAIDVDSPVRQVGLAPDRTMAVPAPGPDYNLAAWYRSSVTPGEQGPSVIIGHVDSRTTGPSVFFDLGRLRPGDRVGVGRADGSTVDFTVYATRTVAKDAFPTAEVYGPTTGPELRLITCGGSFDAAGRSYRDNVVVFARVVGPAGT